MTPEPAPVPEHVAVQLARMEGTLNLVADRIAGVTSRVDRHEIDIDRLKSTTQSLKESASAEATKAIALAAALKEADEARRQKSDQAWSPVAKVSIILAGGVSALTIALQLYQVGR